MTEAVGWSVVQNERGESTWGSRARHWVHVPSLHKVYGSCGRQKDPVDVKRTLSTYLAGPVDVLWMPCRRQNLPVDVDTAPTQVYGDPVDV